MLNNNSLQFPQGLALRPMRDSDKGFVENLYRKHREDLRLLNADEDFIESLIELQYQAQTEGHGNQFPNAMYFIIEMQQQSVGRLTVAFGSNEVRLVNLMFLPETKGKGLTKAIVQGMQLAAQQAMAPLTISVIRNDTSAMNLFANLGFGVLQQSPSHLLLAWYPGQGFPQMQ